MSYASRDEDTACLHDPERLAALAAYDVLDTPAEPEFDDIVFLASTICETPVALVSLVETDRQWFKATVGFEGSETPIEQSVCAHALALRELLVIPDLSADPRTRRNTLVTGEPSIRFYAGAPLVSPSDQVVGTLCVIDTTPRPGGLTDTQRKGLAALARQVVILLETRRNSLRKDELLRRQRIINSVLRNSANSLIAAQEAGKIGTFEVDIATGDMKVSAEFCRIFDVPVAPAYHASLFESLILPEDRQLASDDVSRKSASASASVEYRVLSVRNGVRWIARDSRFERDTQGRPLRMVGAVQDVTDIKKAEETRELLSQELSHRLKNTLATVQAIASQSLRGIADKEAVAAFRARLVALGNAHDILIQKSWEGATVSDIVAAVVTTLGLESGVRATGPEITLGPQAALSLSLILHELATNALKYGALSKPQGQIDLSWDAQGRGKDAAFGLLWAERGGPLVTKPTKKGFGSRLIQLGLVGNGGVVMDFLPAGLSVEITAPFLQLQQTH